MKTAHLRFFVVLLILSLSGIWMYIVSNSKNLKASITDDHVVPGIDAFFERLELIKGKRVGLITNPTGITINLIPTVDTLFHHAHIKLVALFGPEHGIRGDVLAGDWVSDFKDRHTGLPVFSLYGKTRKPTPEMLHEIDVLLFDIQDIGCRTYTYIYTMALAMEAASEHKIPFIVLDRPNPMGGLLVEGPLLEPALSSFIGKYPIPYVHGMTVGELAQLFNQEFQIKADLTVIPMKNWKRESSFFRTHLPWIPTSPHIPQMTTPFYYATVGAIGELLTLNNGVGYTLPFELLGAPWIDGDHLAAVMNTEKLPGVKFIAYHYRPFYSIFATQPISGVKIHISDFTIFKPMLTQLTLLWHLKNLHPEAPIFDPKRNDMFDKAMGTRRIRQIMERNGSLQELLTVYEEKMPQFLSLRAKYLLYQ